MTESGVLSRIADEAAAWVARMDAAHWSDIEERELQAWLAQDQRRRGALLQAQAAWMTLDQPCDDRSALSEVQGPMVRRREIMVGAGALAASLAGGIAWLGSGTTYATEVGEIRRVPLADGSIATINTASEVVVKFVARHRDVKISQGEAWFQVAKDPSRPFRVEAGRVTVRAVGTAFSVRRRHDGADVLVNEGVVEVRVQNAAEAVRLVAGQRAFASDDAKIRVDSVAPSSIDQALAWRAGMIDLAGDTLAEAIAEFNRYNRRPILLTDPALASERFDGVFRTDDAEGFAQAVQQSFDIPVDYRDSRAIRIGAPRA